MRRVTWYFDFVSPFSYLCLARLDELTGNVEFDYRPVLFAGLLQYFGQKGPAEIVAKRRWTYRWCQWSAQRLGLPFRFPATHPFNPLPHLRLAIAARSDPVAVKRIFEALWATGAEPGNPEVFAALARELGVDAQLAAAPEVKQALRENTERAVAAGVFGVPSFEADGEIFWGVDSIDLLKAFLADASVLRNAEMERLDALPVGVTRRA